MYKMMKKPRKLNPVIFSKDDYGGEDEDEEDEDEDEDVGKAHEVVKPSTPALFLFPWQTLKQCLKVNCRRHGVRLWSLPLHT